MNQYYSLVTQAGSAAEANAKGLEQQVNLTEFAVGDSNGVEYEPTGTETALKNEVYRGAISEITVDPDEPNQFIVECVVPQNVGGFTIREAAIYTDGGVLYGIAKYPPSYKTVLENGTSSELRVKFIFTTTSSSLINLVVDPTMVLASREYVDNSFNFVEVSSSTNAHKNKLHIFTAYADLSLTAEPDGTSVLVQVDDGVDLALGECRVTAPQGEQMLVNGKQVDIARFTEVNQSYRFKRVAGTWKV